MSVCVNSKLYYFIPMWYVCRNRMSSFEWLNSKPIRLSKFFCNKSLLTHKHKHITHTQNERHFYSIRANIYFGIYCYNGLFRNFNIFNVSVEWLSICVLIVSKRAKDWANEWNERHFLAKCAFDYSNSEPLLYSDAINHLENPFSLCLVLFISTKEKKKDFPVSLSEKIVFVERATRRIHRFQKKKTGKSERQ